jgi:hypothetical protein
MNELLKLSEVEAVLLCPECSRRYFPKHETIPLDCSCTKAENKRVAVPYLDPRQHPERAAVETLVNALMVAAALVPNAEFPFKVLLVAKPAQSA